MSDRETLALLARALAEVQAIVEAGYKRRQVQGPVLRQVLTVIGGAIRELRVAEARRTAEPEPLPELAASGEPGAEELVRRLRMLLTRVDTETVAGLIAAEEAEGRDAAWLWEGPPAEAAPEPPPAEAATSGEPRPSS